MALYIQYTRPAPCSSLRYLAKIPCYMTEAREAMDKGGVVGGFIYAESMRGQLDYALNHFVMHEIGRQTYQALDGNIPAALNVQKQYITPTEFDYELDGYRHGLFEAFFTQKGTRDAAGLASEICPDSLPIHRNIPVGIYAYPPHPIQQEENNQNQCFHAIGHGLMYANNNDIKLSLSQCDDMPEDWQQQWCYYGAFMQYTYTDWPGYDSDLERHKRLPEGTTMAMLCEEIPERQQNACARLVGRGYVDQTTRGTDENVKAVFDQCLVVDIRFREACIVETAGSFLPEAFSSDPKRAFDLCESLFSETRYQRACVFGLASGIKQGAGKFEYKNQENVCGLVDTQFKDVCARAKGRGYTWF